MLAVGQGLVFDLKADTCPTVMHTLEEVSKARALPLKSKINCIEIADRAAFKKLALQAQARFSQNPKQLHFDEQTTKLLGLVPEDFEYSNCFGALTATSNEAFYDPRNSRFTVPHFSESSRATLVHESVHALQDQHFGLRRLERLAQKSTDQALAISALIEGDASLLQEELGATEEKHSNSGDREDTKCDLPETLIFQYEFPVFFGKLFVKALKADGGWDKVNAAFHKIPATTRDILYTKEYLKKGPHIILTSSTENQDTWGEYSIRTLFRAYLPVPEAQLAAKGWKGDMLKLDHSKNTSLRWETTWDSETDAKEFFVAFAKVLETRFKVRLKEDVASFTVMPNDKYRINVAMQGPETVQVSVKAK